MNIRELFNIERVDLKVKTLKDFITIFLNKEKPVGDEPTKSEDIRIISETKELGQDVFLHNIAGDLVNVGFTQRQDEFPI